MMADAQQEDPEVTLALAGADETGDVLRAIELGDRYRRTLGFLPREAYHAAAKKGTLLLARHGAEVIGYAYFGLTRTHVRLSHLCVHEDYRGRGIARAMVEFLRSRYAQYPGIKARCRRDYELDRMWIKLGFAPVHEKQGKSTELLTFYWLDLGHPNLMIRRASQLLARAAVDLNVVRALAEPDRSDARDAAALVDDQVSDRLELVRTSALDEEIQSIQGELLRGRCLEQVRSFERVHPSVLPSTQVRRAIVKALGASKPGYPVTPQDEFDLSHVTAAIEVAERDEAPVALHPADRLHWRATHPDDAADIEIDRKSVV